MPQVGDHACINSNISFFIAAGRIKQITQRVGSGHPAFCVKPGNTTDQLVSSRVTTRIPLHQFIMLYGVGLVTGAGGTGESGAKNSTDVQASVLLSLALSSVLDVEGWLSQISMRNH
jgi:hypothetical protein